MSNEDMIRELKNVADEYRDKVVHTGEVNITLMCEEVAKRLEELSQPKTDWIPCEERLPELDGGNEYFKQSKCVLVAIEWLDGEITEEVGWYNEGGAWNHDSKNCKVIAWQPLPQPYKKEGNSNENT